MLAIGGNAASTGYNLTRSLRFRSSASAYLNRTPTNAGNRKTFTWSGWVKRGALGINGTLFSNGNGVNANGYFSFRFNTDNTVSIFNDNDGTLTTCDWSFTNVFRDVAAWYHLILAIDTTQATQTNRLKLYVNGVENTNRSVVTYPSQNSDLNINRTVPHQIGQFGFGSSQYFDGYLAEINFVDGSQLTPSSFGSTNTLTGVWQPARYTGTYGTNGFYLPFTDNSALTTSSNAGLGKDFSGNGNYFATNNISITSGVTYDSMTDVPTLTSATASNFCTLNPLDNLAAVPSGGNLNQGVSNPYTRCNSTIFVSSGKWYFEVTLNTAGTNTSVGIGQNNNNVNQYPGYDAKSFVQEIDNARKGTNDTYTAYGTALTAGQVFMCAIDLDNLKLFFGGQGTWFASSNPVTGANPAFTVTAGLYCAISRPYGGSAAISINFGQRPFTYTPPTGYVALNTYNLPTSTIVKGNTVMDATLYTGNGTSQSIVNAGGFKPDFVWIKNRNNVRYHILTDSVRGTNSQLFSNDTLAQEARTDRLTAFNSTGFSVGSYSDVNLNADTFVGWQWQAGQGTTSSNTSGTITSTVSVNASAGFSVVTFSTSAGYTSGTVGHGLGVAPAMYIVKNRNGSSNINWITYHQSVGNTAALYLNSTSASVTSSTFWNNTSPTSSVFSVAGNLYPSSDMVAYCWTPIAGYSAFSSYSGNGSSDGVFVYTGFQPKFIIIKRTDTTGNWTTFDSARDPYNQAGKLLYPNYSNAEETDATQKIDFLSNGFKLRGSNANENASGGTYVYMAFATNPFKQSLAF